MPVRSAIVVIVAVATSTALAQTASVCSAAHADSAATAEHYRNVKDMCDLETDGYARALYRLNTLPPPDGVPQLSLMTRVEGLQVFRVVLEADVFFNWLEAYPIEIGLRKLEELVARLNAGFAIERVEVVGSMDPVESELPSIRVAERRVDFLRKYFIAAGVEPARVVVATRNPTHANTPEGRARDRSAALRVVMLRQRAGGAQ